VPRNSFATSYARRSGSNDAHVGRDARPIIELMEVFSHLVVTLLPAGRPTDASGESSCSGGGPKLLDHWLVRKALTAPLPVIYVREAW